MKDCLFTQLEAASTNSNLLKLATLTINRVYVENEVAADSALSTQRKLIPEGKTVTFTIVGDGYFMSTYGGSSLGKEVTAKKGSSNLTYYTSNGNYDIEIKEKYDITLASLANGMKCDIADTYYTLTTAINSASYYGNLNQANYERITIIALYSTQIGKIFYNSEDIGKFVNLTQLYYEVADGYPEINMSDLGKLTQLTGSNQIPCAVGSIEDFVTSQRAGGRTTFDGSMDLHYIGYSGKVTFNGSVIENIAAGNITWTASTITFRGVTINA